MGVPTKMINVEHKYLRVLNNEATTEDTVTLNDVSLTHITPNAQKSVIDLTYNNRNISERTCKN